MQHKLRDERSEYEGAGIDRQSYDDNAPGHPLEHTDILADGETGIGENDGAECKEIHFAYIIRDEIRHRRNRRRYEDGQNGHPDTIGRLPGTTLAIRIPTIVMMTMQPQPRKASIGATP